MFFEMSHVDIYLFRSTLPLFHPLSHSLLIHSIFSTTYQEQKKKKKKPISYKSVLIYNHSISQSFIGKSKSKSRHVTTRCWCPLLSAHIIYSHKLHIKATTGFYPLEGIDWFLLGATAGLLVILPGK